MIKTVLFDLDGTLLDTTEGVIDSVVYTIKQLGLQDLDYEELVQFVGPPIQQSFINKYGISEQEAQQAANCFRDYYKNKSLFKAKVYPNILELLQNLKNKRIKIGVATYKREDYAIQILEHFGVSKFCDCIHGADNNNKLTKKDIVNLCISELSNDISSTVLIGDTEHDALGAKEANIGFIGVLYGFGFKQGTDLAQYKNIGYFKTVKELENFLLEDKY